MLIFLVGFMSSGKSTIGGRLSKIMHVPFIDLDDMIEKEMGMSIQEVFEKNGEMFFRNIESNFLTSMNVNSETIIASGGGTPCFFNNHHFMQSIGITIYLKVSVNEILRRIKLDNTRPLLNNNKLNLQDFVTSQLLKREKYYQMSNYTIESDNISVNQVYQIIQKIK